MAKTINAFSFFNEVFHFSTNSQAGNFLNSDDGNSISGLITKKNVATQTAATAIGYK